MFRSSRFKALAIAGVALTVGACNCRGDATTDADGVSIGGWYRVELRGASDEIVPFFVSLPADHVAASARLVNGEQQIVAEHSWSGLRVDIAFSVYRTHLEAEARDDGSLAGAFHHESPAFGDSELELRAERIDQPDPELRFRSEGEAITDLPMAWRLTFEDLGDAKLDLSQTGESAVEGILQLENGNAIYLAGNARGDRLALSGFDGSSPYLLDATIAGDRLEAAWIAGPGFSWREDVTGVADPRFELNVSVALAPNAYRIPVPELREPPYSGSPVILVLTGSWSPASMRAVPFLNELYQDHREANLEILALNYEFTEDERHNDEVARTIAEVYDVPWSVVPVDGGAEDYFSIVPAGLENIDVQSFPVLVFINRNGLVHEVRAGFPPQAAGELYTTTIETYRELATEITAHDEL